MLRRNGPFEYTLLIFDWFSAIFFFGGDQIDALLESDWCKQFLSKHNIVRETVLYIQMNSTQYAQDIVEGYPISLSHIKRLSNATNYYFC